MRLSTILRGVAWLGLAPLCSPANAQFLDTYLPASVPGFDQQLGVTVLSRLRPLYRDQGTRAGAFVIRGGLDERFGYDSNITGTPRGQGSALIETNPSISAESDWSRNRLGAAVNIDRFDYLSAPTQSHTNATVAIGGGLTVLGNTIDLGYSHIHGNEFGTDVGAVAYSEPVPFDVDIVRNASTIDLGRFKVVPNVDVRLYQFGNASIGGQSFSQRYRDRVVLSGGVTTRYMAAEQRELILVLQGSSSHYIHPFAGTPSNDTQSVVVLPGVDYQAPGPFRFRLLAGAELRTFSAPQYDTRVAPVFEGSVIYTPTGLTTVTASLSRAIEDPQAEGTSGFTYTAVSVVVDHELRRNVLLQATSSFRTVDYFQGLGSTTAFGFGGGVTWLLNNHLSAFAVYNFARQDGAGQRANFATPQTPVAGLPGFTKNVALVGLRWRL